MKRLPLAAVALVVALAGLAAGLDACSSSSPSGPATDGPLSSAASAHGPIPRGGNCLNRRINQTFADQSFTNYGHAAVVLDRIVLLHPRNERLIAAYAIAGPPQIGVIPWPPAGRAWDHRQPVHGYRVAPGKTFAPVLGVKAAGPGFATSQGMLVYYHDAVGSYEAPNYFAMQISANGSGKGCRD